MNGESRHEQPSLSLGALLLLPLAFLATGAYVRAASGPFWLGPNFDPDYVYLINGLRLVLGLPFWHVDHPGTPIQLLIAAVIRLNGFSTSVLSSDVLAHPEQYLNVTTLVLTLLVSGALFLVGLQALRFSNSVTVALLAQSGPFLSGRLLARDTFRANPEPALILATLLLIAGLFNFGTQEKPRATGYAILAGLVLGFGIACKITFAPLLLVPVVCLPGVRAKGFFGMSAVVSFVAWTLPIVKLYPVVYNWIKALITHQGPYGLGDRGFIAGRAALDGLRVLVGEAPIFMLALCCGIAILSWWGLRRNRNILQRRESASIRMIAGLVGAGFLEAVLVLKHPQPRYMIAGFSLGGALIAVSYDVLGEKGFWRRWWTRLGMAALLATLMVHQYMRFSSEVARVGEWREQAARLDAITAKTLGGCAVVQYYRASSPAFALSFGTHWGVAGDMRRSLERMFPGYLEIWHQPGDWEGDVQWSELFRQNRCVVLRGSEDLRTVKLGPGLSVEPVVEPVIVGVESLYLLKQEGR